MSRKERFARNIHNCKRQRVTKYDLRPLSLAFRRSPVKIMGQTFRRQTITARAAGTLPAQSSAAFFSGVIPQRCTPDPPGPQSRAQIVLAVGSAERNTLFGNEHS